MDRVNNYLYYFLVVAIIGLAAFFFHSYLLALVAIIFSVLPFISAVLLRLSYKGISVSLKDNSTTVKREGEYSLKISVKNKSLIPVPFCCLQLDMVNCFSGEKQTRHINVSVPCLNKRITELKFKPLLCGKINIYISDVRVRDIMCFYQIKTKAAARFALNIIPCSIKLNTADKASEGVSDESEKARKDSAGTEVIQIREYVKGDSLKSIHWKLSAKKNELFVKEKGDNLSDKAILLFELTKSDINGILDTVYTVAKAFVNKNQPVKICWAGGGSEQLSTCVIERERDVYHMFEKVYLSQPVNGNTHTLSVAKRQLTGGSVLYIASAEKGVSIINL